MVRGGVALVILAACGSLFAADDPPPPPPAQVEAAQWTLQQLTQLGLSRNPRLAGARLAVDAASGLALQAGLYPNPEILISGDEISDNTGPGGIWTTPFISQEIVTANKLGLSQGAATRAVDQASLSVQTERYALLAQIRQAYFAVLTLQERVTVLEKLLEVAEQSLDTASKLFEGKQVARLDVLQFQVERGRIRAQLAAARRQRAAGFRNLASLLAVPELPDAPLAGQLEQPFPPYAIDRLEALVRSYHPEIRAAEAGVEQAQLLLRRAEVEPIPNLVFGAGYIRQNQNRSDDWGIALGLPVPLWDRNQGNIRAARAELGRARQRVRQVEYDLLQQLALAWGNFTAARDQVELFQRQVLPAARESLRLSRQAYQGGQFEYLRVLQAQRDLVNANLTNLTALGQLWQAASNLSGLALEDQWPPVILTQHKPPSQSAVKDSTTPQRRRGQESSGSPPK